MLDVATLATAGTIGSASGGMSAYIVCRHGAVCHEKRLACHGVDYGCSGVNSPPAVQARDSASSCSRTVAVARSCLSGG